MTSTTTPFINLPFPARQHPESARIETSTRDWVIRFRLTRSAAGKQELIQGHFGEAAAYGYPDAALPEAELAADWFVWLFFADDHHEEGSDDGTAQKWTDITEAVRGMLERRLPADSLPNTPLIRALADLLARFDAWSCAAWKERFNRHLMDFVVGGLHDIQLREGGIPLPLAEYIPLRRDASAVLTCFDVIEICVHIELPDQIYHSPLFQEILLAGADLFSWINDLYSLEKEIACGIVSNLVLVLQHERRLNRKQAFIAARGLINDRVNDLLAAEERLPKLIDTLQLDNATQAALYRYVAGIHDCIAGSNQWHAHSTRRYQKTPQTADLGGYASG